MSDEADEPTSEIFFETHQWRVTAYGVESLEPGITYEIPAERFLKSSRGDVYDWPVHMAEKTWVDIEAFIEVFTKAVSLHAGKLNGQSILPN